MDVVKKLALKSRMPEARALAEVLDISVDTKYLHKEQDIVQHLCDYLHELKIETEFQFIVGPYRIDLYLPDYKIVVEIDELGHRGRDPHQEQCREAYIKRELDCLFFV